MSEENRIGAMASRLRTVSNRSRKEEWKCKICNETFKDDRAEILECEYCEEHICRKCLQLSTSEYKLMSKRSDIHWYCPPCETKAVKNLKIEKEVQERCKEYYEKLEKRLDMLEKKIDEKPDRAEVESMIKDCEQKTQSGGKNADETMEERLADLRESESRKNNIVIYGLEEFNADNPEERRREDAKKAEELCSVLETNSDMVGKVIRLGKRPEPADSARVRPVKIEFCENGAKITFMKNLKKLATSQKFRKISVMHDMTKREREENRRKVQEAKELNEAEQSENFKHIIVGPPWDRRIVRVKKKNL